MWRHKRAQTKLEHVPELIIAKSMLDVQFLGSREFGYFGYRIPGKDKTLAELECAMSFRVCWTSSAGSEQAQVPDAEEAIQKYANLLGTVANLAVKDDRGNRVSYDDLVMLSVINSS